MSQPLTPAMKDALRMLVNGQSLRGVVHTRTYRALLRRGFVDGLEVITEAGRVALDPQDARYKQPCPNPPKGERCQLCGGAYVCMQPNRPKKAIPTT